MKYLFVPYQLALTLKQKGFMESCIAWWFEEEESLEEVGDICRNDDDWMNIHDCAAPTYQQVIEWLDFKDIYITCTILREYGLEPQFAPIVVTAEEDWTGSGYDTRAEALDEAITHALTLIQ